jgi:hypothetical protein
MHWKAIDKWLIGCDIKSKNAPSSLNKAKILSINIVLSLVNAIIVTGEVEHGLVRAFEEVFVKIYKNIDSGSNVHINMAIKLINEFWNVRHNPEIVFCSTLIVYTIIPALCQELNYN